MRGPVVLVVVAGIAALAVGASMAGRGKPRAAAPQRVKCEEAEVTSLPEKPTYKEPPSERLSQGRHVWVLDTSCGKIDILLDVERAPKTTSSIAFLTREGFYDGTVFHRVVPGFVIQGGDPEARGTGGPGYTVAEAPPDGLKYEPGVVAMAKRQDEPRGASGSQFFIVSGAQAAGLPPDFALVGRVITGMDVVKEIERVGGQKPVVVDRATIE